MAIPKIIQALLSAGADVHAKQKDNWTALIFHSSHGHIETVQAILAAGANVDAKQNNNWTALCFATQKTMWKSPKRFSTLGLT